MEQHHYSGLTDAEVLESRAQHGANILTPPAETTTWQKIKDCWHFWLVKTISILFVLSVVAVAALLIAGMAINDAKGNPVGCALWIGPAILGILFLMTYFVSFLGGDWDEEERHFDMDPLITILLAALVLSGAISFYQGVFTGEGGIEPYFEPIGIAVAVLLATGVAYILERKNEKTFKSLNQVNDETLVKVIRNNNVCQVLRKDIVVGDIVLLTTGEEVPADSLLLDALNLNMNESSLTGEPSCHKTIKEEDFDKEATYPSNHIMKGTTIMEGYCTAQVFAVGDATECGKVFEAAQVREGDATPLSKKLDQLADLITKASYIIAGLIVVARIVMIFVNGDAHFDTPEGTVAFIKFVLDSIMIAVTLIVVAVPEGLPMAVTLSLAFSMKRLMEQNTLPRTMHACETMGATSVICTDKTGTLTQNQMQVHETLFPGLEEQHLDHGQLSSLIKEAIATNTTANLDTTDPEKVKAVGSPTEGAMILWLNSLQVDYLQIRESVKLLDRIPFSTEIKYMASIVDSQVMGKRVLYVTGAPDILLRLCGTEGEQKQNYDAQLSKWQAQAKRTLGLAYAVLDEGQNPIVDGKLQAPATLDMIGIVGISDPIRTEVPNAIRECISAGIDVIIITGDTIGTAKEIGRQVGLWTDKDGDANILTGIEVEQMSDEELRNRLPMVKIISRARPSDKERAVRTLKGLNKVVAVTGDGTNDAPALNAANVGLSMGDGTAVAKEASDMTIMDNSFRTIANAVMWGRSLYKNIKRFILFQMTVNVVACLIVLIGAFTGEESPLTVTQMLWVNLIMDTFAALALASLPPTHEVMKEQPRDVNEHILKGMGARILGVGLFFTAILLGVLYVFQHADVTALYPFNAECYNFAAENAHTLTPYELGLFFTLFVMLQFFNLFNAKAFMTKRSAFSGLSFKNTKWFILIALVIFVGQILLVQAPGLQEMFNVAEGGIAFNDWVVIILSTSLVLWVGEIVRLFRRKK